MQDRTSQTARMQDPAAYFRETLGMGWCLTRAGFQHPKHLARHGWTLAADPDAEDVSLARGWIVRHTLRRRTLNPSAHSAVLASAAGVPEGAFIAAAIALGFPFRHEFQPDCSATFAMGLRFQRNRLNCARRILPVASWPAGLLHGRAPLRRPRA